MRWQNTDGQSWLSDGVLRMNHRQDQMCHVSHVLLSVEPPATCTCDAKGVANEFSKVMTGVELFDCPCMVEPAEVDVLLLISRYL